MSRRAQTARLLVLGLLLLNVPGALLLAASQVRWVLGAPAVGTALLLAGYAVLQGLVLHAAVTPWAGEARKGVVGPGLVLSTVALAAPLTLMAEPGGAPWAWVAGFAVGALVVLHPGGRGAALVAVTALSGGAVSVLLGGGLRSCGDLACVDGGGRGDRLARAVHGGHRGLGGLCGGVLFRFHVQLCSCSGHRPHPGPRCARSVEPVFSTRPPEVGVVPAGAACVTRAVRGPADARVAGSVGPRT